MLKGAEITKCGVYRYRLWRIWSPTEPRLMFIMLNPSTADAERDDPTIRRLIDFAKAFEFGGIEVANLYAFCATDPDELKAQGYPVGEQNDAVILGLANTVVRTFDGKIVCAWGTKAQLERADRVLSLLLSTGHCVHSLGLTKEGHPRHPLYLPRETELQQWDPEFDFI